MGSHRWSLRTRDDWGFSLAAASERLHATDRTLRCVCVLDKVLQGLETATMITCVARISSQSVPSAPAFPPTRASCWLRGRAPFPRKAGRRCVRPWAVGSLGQEPLPPRGERRDGVLTFLRGVVAVAELVEQVGTVGCHQ